MPSFETMNWAGLQREECQLHLPPKSVYPSINLRKGYRHP